MFRIQDQNEILFIPVHKSVDVGGSRYVGLIKKYKARIPYTPPNLFDEMSSTMSLLIPIWALLPLLTADTGKVNSVIFLICLI